MKIIHQLVRISPISKLKRCENKSFVYVRILRQIKKCQNQFLIYIKIFLENMSKLIFGLFCLLSMAILMPRQVDCETNARIILSNEDKHLVTSMINRIIHTKIMQRPNVRTPKVNPEFYPVNNSTTTLKDEDVEPTEPPQIKEPKTTLNVSTFDDDLLENHDDGLRVEEISNDEIQKWNLVNFFQHPMFLAMLGVLGFLIPFLLILAVCLPFQHQRRLQKRRQNPDGEIHNV